MSDVTPEAWRHWRSTVRYLANKRGKAARFSIGDVVVLSIMRHAVHDLGASVARLAPGFEVLCASLYCLRPAAMTELIALISPSGAILISAEEFPTHWPPFAIAIPCRPIVERLLSTTFEAIADVQPSLPFAPRILRRS